MSNEHTAKLLEAEKSFHEKIEALRRENKDSSEKSTLDTESLRQQKDAKIRQMEREKEDQRNLYEVRINDLDSKIKSKRNDSFVISSI